MKKFTLILIVLGISRIVQAISMFQSFGVEPIMYSYSKYCPKERPILSTEGFDSPPMLEFCHKPDKPILLSLSLEDKEYGEKMAFYEKELLSFDNCQKRNKKVEEKYQDKIKDRCVSCEDDIPLRDLGADLCPNRFIYKEVSYLRKKCPSDKKILHLENSVAECAACNEEKSYFTSKEECDKCPERFWFDNICAKKCDAPLIWTSTSHEIYCTSCDRKDGIWTSKEECSKCPNKVYVDGYCFDPCPLDKPLRQRGLSMCWPCNYNPVNPEDISESDCAKCPDLRYFDGKQCHFRYSPYSDYPLISSTVKICKSEGGECFDKIEFFSCETKEILKTTPENCTLCPNRKYVNGNCILEIQE